MEQVDISQLLAQIREEVEIKRSRGEYPPGLEQQLEREFADIMSSTNRTYFVATHFQAQLTLLEALIQQSSGQVAHAPKGPKVSFLRRLMAKQSQSSIETSHTPVKDVHLHLLEMLKVLGEFARAQEDADKRLVRELNQHVLDRVAVIDHLAQLTIDLESRIRDLESHTR